MFANKYEINITTISTASTATTINIPINLEYQIVDQSELIDRVFVTTEVAKSINPIFDYEKIRIIPTSTSTSNILNAVQGGGTSSPTTTTTSSVPTSGVGTVAVSTPTGGLTPVGSSTVATAPATNLTSPSGNFAAGNPAAATLPVGSPSVITTVSAITPNNAATVGSIPVGNLTNTIPVTSPTSSPATFGGPSLGSVNVGNAGALVASNSLTLSSSSNSVATLNTGSSSLVAVGNVGTSNAATLGGFNVAAGTGNVTVNSGGNFGAGSGPTGGGGFTFAAFSSGSNPLPSTFNSSNCQTNLSGTNVNNIIYNVNFLVGSPASMTVPTTYNDIGITDADIKFRTNAFEQSFLNLMFYDSDNALEQRLISYITLFPNLTGDDLNPLDSTTGLPGQPKPSSEINVSFVISNPLLECPLSVSEGFYLYDYKDTIPMGGIKYLYMRASFNNAKTGKMTNLMVDDSAYTIDNLVHKLYTRYVLARNSTGFFYKIDDTYNLNTTGNHVGFNNVTYTNNNIIVDLYQIQAL